MKLKPRIKQGIAAGLVGLVTFFSGCGSNNKLIDAEALKHPYAETALVSDQVLYHGGVVRGDVRQDTLLLNLNDRLSGYIWQNYSFREGEINERDYRIWYTQPISENLSIGAGYHFFDYPSGSFGDYDSAVVAEAHYKGPVDLDFDFTQLIPNKNTSSGTRIYVKASKSFPIFKKDDLEIILTPSISTSYVDEYFNITGPSQFTGGINLGIIHSGINKKNKRNKKNKGNFGIEFFLNMQEGLVDEIEDFTWVGGRLKIKF